MTPDAPRRLGRCPICKAPAQPETRPFCSRRCRDIDLARWLGGGYAIAGGDTEADAEGAGSEKPRGVGPEGTEDESD